MIPKLAQKIKLFYQGNKNDLFIALIIFLVGMAGFGLGRLSVLWIPKEPITMEGGEGVRVEGKDGVGNNVESKNFNQEASILKSIKGQFVASKNGASYHFPWCPGAQKIKEGNKVWFQTKEEAEGKGYKPAGNCPGL